VRVPRIAAVAAAAVALAFSVNTTAEASTPIWKVVNPNANGSFTGVSPSVVLKNAAGSLAITCSSVTVQGTMTSKSDTYDSLGRITGASAPTCTDQDGRSWAFVVLGASYPGNYLHAASYDAATGRTTLTIGQGNIFFQGPGCGFEVYTSNGTYTNGSSTLATSSGVIRVGANSEGQATCVGRLKDLETVTFAMSIKLSPAITITREAG
jgi:hypothetical protein